LSDIKLSDSRARMGRPPLGVKQFVVYLHEEMVARVDALVGAHRRSKFIREAVEEKLAREAASRRDGVRD